VSIFVNPAQFAPHEDFGAYPRTLAADLAALATADGDLVFNPSVAVVYPDGFATTVSLAGPAAVGLEDAFRPTHFQGVATVVAKLLIQAQPDIAIFGEKDYQQLKVVTRMARDLDLPVTIVPAPTIREADGLALSSRNAYLSPQERATAPVLHRTLREAARCLRGGEDMAKVLAEARHSIAEAGFVIDYVEARDAETLAPLASLGEEPARLLVAARIGKTRLIDNIAV
jgi:pantoate--beta-alanine ligase